MFQWVVSMGCFNGMFQWGVPLGCFNGMLQWDVSMVRFNMFQWVCFNGVFRRGFQWNVLIRCFNGVFKWGGSMGSFNGLFQCNTELLISHVLRNTNFSRHAYFNLICSNFSINIALRVTFEIIMRTEFKRQKLYMEVKEITVELFKIVSNYYILYIYFEYNFLLTKMTKLLENMLCSLTLIIIVC